MYSLGRSNLARLNAVIRLTLMYIILQEGKDKFFDSWLSDCFNKYRNYLQHSKCYNSAILFGLIFFILKTKCYISNLARGDPKTIVFLVMNTQYQYKPN